MRSSFVFRGAALALLGWLLGSPAQAAPPRTVRVADVAAFTQAVPRLLPGDTLVLAAGDWTDAQLTFTGAGTAAQNIVLRAERPGAVKMRGKSSLRVGGSYLVVSGLDFRDGGTTEGVVMEFRAGSKNLAFNCRVTNCVIDNYNSPDRAGSTDNANWIKLYGQHNRFDHNYIANKKDNGTTLIVDLADERSRENEHRIDHNYFGPRPRLGSNGGETIRVGTSTYSLSPSRTVIEENYFYRCNGEVEIISVKSCDNVIRRNLFEECEGSLVMRHGNRNLVEGNYFLGNGKEQTGGIRVINAGHRIVDNYFADLRGDNFRSALVLMNGVPNSPLNRYSPVQDVTIANNVFVNCASMELGTGKDSERSVKPENVTFTGNIFYSPQAKQLFRLVDDISGITFKDNLVASSREPGIAGLTPTALTLRRSADGLLVPVASAAGPAPTQRRPVLPTQTGPAWFRPTGGVRAGAGRVWPVASQDADALRTACQQAKAGDVLELTDGGPYAVPTALAVRVPLTVRAKAGLTVRPVLQPVGGPAFRIENGGALRLAWLAFDGRAAGAASGPFVTTADGGMVEHYGLWADNCTFAHLPGAGGSALLAAKGTYADTVQFTNCRFDALGATALRLAAETDDKGTYNAEYVLLRNCLFRDVVGAALDLYRGGKDESTLGPFLTVDHCTFDHVGTSSGYVLKLNGVQWSEIRNSLFAHGAPGGVAIQYTGDAKVHNVLASTNFSESGKLLAASPPRTTNVTYLPTTFLNPQRLDYRLKEPAPGLPAATDGRPLGYAK